MSSIEEAYRAHYSGLSGQEQARKTAGALGCGEILEQMEREARERFAGEG